MRKRKEGNAMKIGMILSGAVRRAARLAAAAALLASLLCVPVNALTAGAPQADTRDYKLLALTFDDGPGPYTGELLDGLAERGVRCTFFLVGSRIGRQPDLVRRMAEEGHQLANHSWDHATLTTANVESEISSTAQALRDFGGDETYYVRPPYGTLKTGVAEKLSAPAILWSLDPLDWRYRNTRQVTDTIVGTAQDGDIILLHDIHPTSVAAALRVIDILRERGFEFVTVAELLRRRGVEPVNGQTYTCARNSGVNLPPAEGYYDEALLEQHWAYPAIRDALALDLFAQAPDGCFYPEKDMTRAMLAVALGRLAGEAEGPSPELWFSDVSPESGEAALIRWASAQGIMVGSGGSTPAFCPDEPVTREQFAVILRRFLIRAGFRTEPSDAAPVFSDAGEISPYAVEAVRFCAEAGLLRGREDGCFAPRSGVTRAEAAVMILGLREYLLSHAPDGPAAAVALAG